MRETQVWSLAREDPLEKEMATHSSTLAWRIPWTEKPGRLQSTGSQRLGHDWATSLHIYASFWHHGQQSNLVECMCSWSQGLFVFFSWGWVLFRTQGRPRSSSPSGRYDPLIRSYMENQAACGQGTGHKVGKKSVQTLPHAQGHRVSDRASPLYECLFSLLQIGFYPPPTLWRPQSECWTDIQWKGF